VAACAIIASTIFWSLDRHAEYVREQMAQAAPRKDQPPLVAPAPDAPPSTGDYDLADLPADQQDDLLDAVGTSGGDDTSSSVAAAASNSDDVDNIFLGLNSDSHGGTQ
jgi:hypothetical protein